MEKVDPWKNRQIAGSVKMNKNKRILISLFLVITILAGFWFAKEVLAGYYSSGTLTSINLLSGQTVITIDSFGYIVSSIPAGTNLKVQFSQDASTWKNSTGTTGSWDTLSVGTNSISLSTLGWSGPNFYYKIEFTSDGTGTPILDEISVGFSSCNADGVSCSVNGDCCNSNCRLGPDEVNKYCAAAGKVCGQSGGAGYIAGDIANNNKCQADGTWLCIGGYYSSGGSCVVVGCGYWSADSSDTRTACTAGTYVSGNTSTSSGDCSNCAANFYSNDGACSCTECAVSQYSAAGSSSCTAIPTPSITVTPQADQPLNSQLGKMVIGMSGLVSGYGYKLDETSPLSAQRYWGTSTSYTNSSLDDNTRYCYKAKIQNAETSPTHYGSYSSEVCNITKDRTG